MIYFDNSATTFPSDRVRQVVSEMMKDEFSGNPGSLHKLGVSADKTYGETQAKVAKLLGASSDEIIFTSCATESANTAIRGFLSRNQRAGKRVISTRSSVTLTPLSLHMRSALKSILTMSMDSTVRAFSSMTRL